MPDLPPEGRDERGASRNVVTAEDLDDRERAGDRQMPGAQTFATPPPDDYEGRIVCWEVVRLGDHAHLIVCTGRQHAAGNGRPTFHRGEAGRLVMQWEDWLHLRGALDAGPEWLWVAEVEYPTPAQLDHYAGARPDALAESEARERELERERDELRAAYLTDAQVPESRIRALKARETALVEALRARDDLLRRCLPFVAEHGGAYPERDEIEAILNGPALDGVIEAEPGEAEPVRVWIDRQHYDFNKRLTTGAKLRNAAGIAEDRVLWREALTPDREDVEVPEEQGFALMHDDRFYSAPRFIGGVLWALVKRERTGEE